MRFLYRPDLPEPAPLRWLGDMVDIALTLLAAMLLVVMFANVAARVALNSDLAWNTEFGEFVLLWATFLGGATAARRGAHMRITEVTDKMPPGLQKAVELATRLGVVGLLVLLISYGWSITESTMGQELTVLHVPMGLQYLAMPVGSALALVFVLYEMALLLGSKPLPQEAFQD
ncbi:TRAP transporter small permease [Bosea sp. (in: a-proteobacteria)]|jgi:TRAP-type C4-dicarboxylate transport system permease small subunit|uniref:TRAP transporter small permease n=1 Tax=Bosea sp. (in: a-proteobacteria) TaxID=1871050 RepID=UPI002DDC9E2A|nr:TRAP transporter small permease [Bosea sp. (in: a-proteobacteria)]HEV2508336.1 TRAP transporter small permease [Bosea sp. (in: a-proteobacteria)]